MLGNKEKPQEYLVDAHKAFDKVDGKYLYIYMYFKNYIAIAEQ